MLVNTRRNSGVGRSQPTLISAENALSSSTSSGVAFDERAGVAAVEHQPGEPLGVPGGVLDRDGSALRHRHQGEPLEAGVVRDGFEVGDPGLERVVGDVAVGQAVPALVEPDDGGDLAELDEVVPPHRALPVVLEVAQPAGVDEKRWPRTVDGVGDAGAVGGPAEPDVLDAPDPVGCHDGMVRRRVRPPRRPQMRSSCRGRVRPSGDVGIESPPSPGDWFGLRPPGRSSPHQARVIDGGTSMATSHVGWRTRTVALLSGAALITGLVTVAVPAAAQRGAAASVVDRHPVRRDRRREGHFHRRARIVGRTQGRAAAQAGRRLGEGGARHVDQEGEVRLCLDRASDDHEVPGRRAGGEGGWHREAGRHHARQDRDDPGTVGFNQLSRRRPQSEAVAATGTFLPPRPGRAVRLQRQAGSGWTTAGTGVQGPGGSVTISRGHRCRRHLRVPRRHPWPRTALPRLPPRLVP